jgi:hypothetical protein
MLKSAHALAGAAAVSLVIAAGLTPAVAASPMAPAVTVKGSQAGIQNVGDRGWDGGWRHKRRHDDDDFRFGFSFGAPYAYYPPRAVYRCPPGYRFDGYGCAAYRVYHPYPYHYGVRPGFSVQLGF